MVERKDSIRNAYRHIGSNGFYDGMITCSTFLGRVVSRLVWDMNADDCAEYQTRALSGIPERFSGRLLEVPVGTGILTMPVYQTLPAAKITCVDYSPDMMAQAETKAKRLGLKNIVFKQGDVGNMPFEDCSFDVVVSLNGFHAFPDKEAAYKETFRVLKNGGIFCGCFYVKGLRKRTDCIIRSIYQPMKLFVPPYETKDSLKNRLKSIYADVNISNVKGIACFVCRKASTPEQN
ncbi:MAG: class I SAM-dependent methyltransferase [Ruminococcaceae bacterium]|nr:class I SAM-dependent methyltransferase [Oscillospiraceae bacterium]